MGEGGWVGRKSRAGRLPFGAFGRADCLSGGFGPESGRDGGQTASQGGEEAGRDCLPETRADCLSGRADQTASQGFGR